MNISKALKTKNKLALEYQKVLDRAIKSNCTVNNAEKNYSSIDLLAKSNELLNELVNLKTRIHTASEPIRTKIFEISEKKNLMSKLQGMQCKNGTEKTTTYSGNVENTYVSEISQLELDKMLVSIQEEIDTMQEEIDTFNAITQI